MPDYRISDLNKVTRGPKRAAYDQEQIHGILDDTFLCHIAYTWQGQAIVIPTAYGRDGDKLYIHGSLKNRMMTCLLEAGKACVSVTRLDGLVLARSAFHHSANYRSVNIFGSVRAVEDDTEKMHALRYIINHMVPDHWAHVRQPNDKELRATLVLEISIDTASAKIRAEGVIDDKEDHQLPLWAGVIPVAEVTGTPISDPLLPPGIEIPRSVEQYVNR
ncbi:pyridoxamine 5'-phosphate oxidase family protein [Sinomicrobium soli]|uniref:pyridoxamine 5'-phosphate oxidase family protein n=1 Tax=Sinomicrobium sp. N-1-3-6 TaxID=2219864 RepID=UPI000DCDD3AA|nr:pyridoxamine 5'-phosphate oxidase family protein [Sinomicrobium sp. N-1-3-6]RAV28553.1 pyridoxamine 5'-phosphate oxidase family protein [Sinomicrobium sp. N-1-3-6]